MPIVKLNEEQSKILNGTTDVTVLDAGDRRDRIVPASDFGLTGDGRSATPVDGDGGRNGVPRSSSDRR